MQVGVVRAEAAALDIEEDIKMRRISLPNYISRSGARFETTERFLQSTTVVNSTESELKSAGVPLTHIDENTYATSTDELHCFIIGDSGCGKTRRVILPTIRLLAKAGESMVVSDPKGELYRLTSNSLRKKGYTVRVLNFRNPCRGNRWNPLGAIDALYHNGDSESKDKALMMLNDIVDVLQQGQRGEKDPFWAMAAASVLRGTSLMILEYGNEGELTFENIAVTARDILDKISSSDFIAFIKSLPKSSPIYQNLSVIITNARDTRNCIMAEFEAMVSSYTSQELLLDLFATSEIDVRSLGLSPTALFFILPDDTEALYPIATVFVKQIYSTLIALADEQQDGKLPNRVTFLLDEFANFAKMPSVEAMLTAARSRRIRFVLVCQAMDQLTSKYGEFGRETLLANCRTWIYMSCKNLPFLRRLEELTGYYLSPYTHERIPLIDIGELQHFEIGQVLVLNDRCRPMIGYLPDYSQYDFGVDGNDTTIEMPTPHELIPRKLFHLEDGLEKAKKRNAPIIEQRAQEAKQEVDGLRASILEKIAAQRQKELDESENERASDVDQALSFDKLFEKMFGSDDDPQEDDDDNDSSETLSAMELFRQGNYYQAAQESIERAKILDDSSSKNNVAFLIRYGKLDPSKLSAPFSLAFSDLLEDGIKEKEPYSLVNFALYEIEAKHYKKASDMFMQLSAEDWAEVAPFWIEELYNKHNQDPEGALIAIIADRNCDQVGLQDDCVKQMYAIAYNQFGNYMDSPHFQKVYKDHEKGACEKPSKDSSFSSKLDELLSADEEPEKDISSNKSDSTGLQDLKAQLQKKLQDKLKRNAEKSDEDDDE